MSMVKTAANVVAGYVLATATQIVVFPRFGIKAALGAHVAVGLVFVRVSLARGYLLRRLYSIILRLTASSVPAESSR